MKAFKRHILYLRKYPKCMYIISEQRETNLLIMKDQMIPADIRNKVNEMEEELINYAGTDKYDEKQEEIEQVKREANKQFGFMYNI